jgi:anti-sigma factor RsiW
MNPVSNDQLMRYLDGELPRDEHQNVEDELARSTELQREAALYRSMKEDLQGLPLRGAPAGRSVWDAVNRKIARPFGWLLLIVGTVVWLAYGSYVYATSSVDPLEKVATGGVVIGILLLLTSVIWERYRESLTDPYKDVRR